jgi:hypothetical protein
LPFSIAREVSGTPVDLWHVVKYELNPAGLDAVFKPVGILRRIEMPLSRASDDDKTGVHTLLDGVGVYAGGGVMAAGFGIKH